MIMGSIYMICLCIILSLTTYASAFWWGTSETNPPPRYYYHKRLIQNNPYVDSNRPPNGLPAVPVQVPLQAQLAPLPNVQNVQLVPCLCPVSQEYPYENQQYDNVYLQQFQQGSQQQPKIVHQQPNK